MKRCSCLEEVMWLHNELIKVVYAIHPDKKNTGCLALRNLVSDLFKELRKRQVITKELPQ